MQKHLILILSLGLFLFSCSPNPGKGTPDFTIQYDTIPGVDANLLSLDIYNDGIPAGAPVVIWIHGGAWAVGDKSNGMEFKEELCRNQGYVLVSINYRLSTAGSGIIYPTHVQDVAKAIAWIYNNISGYGGDPGRMAVLGHSAGAHLASIVCTNETYLQAEGLSLNIISGCGSFDTQAYDIPLLMANGGGEVDTYTNAFGTDNNNWVAASSSYHVDPGKGIPPFLLARRGESLRQQICNAFRDSLVNDGIPCTVIDATSLNHEQVNDHIGAPGDEVMTDPLVNFLQSIF